MELRDILYVKAVADFKNLTKAADYLHITQPSLSQSIKGIEDRLSVALFHRSKKGMELTTAGALFLRDATPLLNEYHLFLSKIKDYGKETSAHCIGLYKLSYTTPINDAIMDFISSHSEDNYIIKVAGNESLEQMLLSHQLDLAIAKYTPIASRRSALSYDTLFREKLYVLLNSSHPLAKNESLSVKQLAGNKLITSDPNEYPYLMTSQMLKDAGITLEIHTHTNYSNVPMILDLVEKNLGIAFATRDVCTHFTREKVIFLPLEEEYFYDFCIVQRPGDKNRDKNRVLIDYIKEFLSLY